MVRRFGRMELILPPRGPARWGVIAALVLGGVVALLVPAVFVLMLVEMLAG